MYFSPDLVVTVLASSFSLSFGSVSLASVLTHASPRLTSARAARRNVVRMGKSFVIGAEADSPAVLLMIRKWPRQGRLPALAPPPSAGYSGFHARGDPPCR